jgi:hypothetical protein
LSFCTAFLAAVAASTVAANAEVAVVATAGRDVSLWLLLPPLPSISTFVEALSLPLVLLLVRSAEEGPQLVVAEVVWLPLASPQLLPVGSVSHSPVVVPPPSAVDRRL